MRFSPRQIGSTAALMLALAGCIMEQDAGPSPTARAQRTCISISARLTETSSPRPFTSLLSLECTRALKALRADGDAVTSWHAAAFLRDLGDLEDVIGKMGHIPTETGEYLISRQLGLTRSLNTWKVSEKHAQARDRRQKSNM